MAELYARAAGCSVPFDRTVRPLGESAASATVKRGTVRSTSTPAEFAMKSYLFALAAFVLVPITAAPQIAVASESATGQPAETRQFDFLLGQWQLDVHPKVNSLAAMIHGAPKLVGTWKAWRTLDGLGIEDEMRIVDASGNPLTLQRSLRIWAGGETRWKAAAVDAYHGRSSESSGTLQDGVMRMDGRSSGDGKIVLTRTRYFDIGANAFRMQQDRSEDDGKTWDEAVLTIDAKRTAATAAP
jgi:hypothetical protein